MQRTLTEEAIGFHLEQHKRRNLLNSAGGGKRKGTLGHRSRAKGLSDTYCLRADGSSYIMARRGNRTTAPQASSEPATIVTKHYAPPKHDIARYLPYIATYPNVLTLYRARPTTARSIDVNVGSGRGW